MLKTKTMDGNEACAHVAYMFTEVAGIYPITPSSPMAEYIDVWSGSGRKNIFNDTVKVVQMQSEAGAAGMVHGSLQSGCLTTTFTASQGLLLMIPNMYKIAGEMLPAVFHVAARSIATHALSILGDHQDVYATRMTGFAMLASTSVQEAMDLAAVAHLSAIKSSLPFLHFFDGFRTSHELKNIEVLEMEDIKSLIDMEAVKKFKVKSLSPSNVVTRGTTQNEDIYFQASEVRNLDYNKLPDIVNYYMQEISKITGREYKPFNYYGDINATKVIVAMGSVCDTVKEVVDDLNKKGDKVGLIEVHLYRPFSSKYFFNVLPNTVSKIAVLDRTKEPGSNGEPLYLDVVNMFNKEERNATIVGGRYGLSSKNTDPSQIKSIYDYLDNESLTSEFTIGIDDDVTNLSLPRSDYKIENANMREMLIYGYGSDGMITASKDIIKIIGNNTNNYVQGYFQYDSKKSSGLTRSHLRFSNSPIRSSYFVSNPEIVVCSKESYLFKYDMISNIKNGGIFLYSTSKSIDELKEILPDDMKETLYNKKIKFYIIDAYELANKHDLHNKISMILATCILRVSNLIDFDLAYTKIKDMIEKNFLKKGQDVIDGNLNSIAESLKYLKEVRVDEEWLKVKSNTKIDNLNFDEKVYVKMTDLSANELKVSDFLPYKDGTYLSSTSQYEKRKIAESLPVWINENCIQCNQCSFVCPHSVIRPFLLDEKEYNNAPKEIKDRCIDALGLPYKFYINISVDDCTGCGVCARTCPGKMGEKALIMEDVEDYHDETTEYLMKFVRTKSEVIKPNVKFSQFAKPLFEYSGACAGCGETPYLKLLSQLFGDRIMVANATGCSSIYGASMPSSSWGVPWANSLFEDNAEFGFGMLTATNTIRHRIYNLIKDNIDNSDDNTKELLNKWLNGYDNYEITKEVYEKLDYEKAPYLKDVKEYIKARSIWTIGGDGWAYDIGFGGIDHVLSSNQNVNILVLDSQVYSNTGGQSSKASERGSIAKFASFGKKTAKKDLARIAMCYPNVYVASVCMGANMQQTLSAFVDAEKHDGPSLIIAYSTCIEHGIKGGMGSTIEEEQKAVKSGYVQIFRYNPINDKFVLDYKSPDFALYESFLDNENRFAMLKAINSDKADELRKEQKEDAMKRFAFYKALDEKSNL